MRLKRLLTLLCLACLVIVLLPLSAAQAGEGGGDVSQLKLGELASPTKEFSKMLSGRSWLITSGLDPVLGIGLGDVKEAPQGSGSGSPAQQGAGGAALVP